MRIALVRPDRIGDCVLASCAVRDVLAASPEAEIFWIVRDSVAPLFSGRDFPATLFSIGEAESAEAIANRLAPLHLDAIAHLNPDPRPELAARIAKIPQRVGIGTPGNTSALTRAITLDKRTGLRHEAVCGRRIINLLEGLSIDEFAPLRTAISPAASGLMLAAESAPELITPEGLARSPFALLHPGAHGGKTRLPNALIKAAARHLTERHGLALALIGGPITPADIPGSELPGALDLRGKLPIEATAHLMKAASLAVSRDSGPAHLAAALGTPTVCLFLENTPAMGPARWSPIGPRTRTITTPATPRLYEFLNYNLYRRRAAGAIRVDAVTNAIDALLRGE